MKALPVIAICPTHGLLIKTKTARCALCVYFWDITPELIEAFKKHEAHPPGMVNTIGLAFFDPREHCFTCKET